MLDWAEIRTSRFSPDNTPDDWPKGVSSISINGVSLLGVHEKSGKLYWDGKELVTRPKIRLGTLELWIVGIAAAGTFGSFMVEAGKVLGWWT